MQNRAMFPGCLGGEYRCSPKRLCLSEAGRGVKFGIEALGFNEVSRGRAMQQKKRGSVWVERTDTAANSRRREIRPARS